MVDVKPSTAAELAGFVLLAVAAFIWTPIAGLVVAGSSLLLIGYALDDDVTALSVRRMTAPVARRRASWKVSRQNRRFRRTAEKRDRTRTRNQPAEVVVRVEQ